MTEVISQKIATHLKTLIRGLTQEDVQARYKGYKALFKIGAPAVPQVREAILQSSFSRVKRSNEIRYIAGLVSLLRDIDEQEADKILQRIFARECDPAIKSLLLTISNFTLADYNSYQSYGINVFEHKTLSTRGVKARLEKWLSHVPAEDLAELDRLFIIRERDNPSTQGNYTPILFNISVAWNTDFAETNPFMWLMRLNTQYTLYHEVGHHKHRHTFGQIPEQEEEADEYAKRLMQKSHPLTRILGKAKKLLRLSNSKHQGNKAVS